MPTAVTVESVPIVDVSVTVPSLATSAYPFASTSSTVIVLALVPSAGSVVGTAVIVLSASDALCATVSAAEPTTPSAVAVTVVTPFATAVARPLLAPMLAVPAAVLFHTKVAPGMTASDASSATAVNCCVASRAVSVAAAGVTLTLAMTRGGTGVNSTVTSLPSGAPPMVPLTVAVPAIAETSVAVYVPSPWSATTDSTPSVVASVTTPPLVSSGLSLASRSLTKSVEAATPSAGSVPGSASSVLRPGATTGETCSAALPVTPAAVALIAVAPSPTAVASPVSGFTVATVMSSLVQPNTTPATGVPSACRASAVNGCAASSAVSVAVGGLTTIVVTTIGRGMNSTVASSLSATPSSVPSTRADPAVPLTSVAR